MKPYLDKFSTEVKILLALSVSIVYISPLFTQQMYGSFSDSHL